MPRWARRAGKKLGVKRQGGKVVAALPGCSAAAVEFGLDHGDGLEPEEALLAWVAAIREQPIDVVANRVAAGFDPSVIALDHLDPAQQPAEQIMN